MQKLKKYLGKTDIYLLDQIMKGRFLPEYKILDAGCGGGRNLYWMSRNGYSDLFGIDRKEEVISKLKGEYPDFKQNFHVSAVEKMPFEDEQFDRVISSAVLHFAKDENHFWEMLGEMWRVLSPKGMLFIRMTSIWGLEGLVQSKGSSVYQIPDGTTRFLLNDELLNEWKIRYPFSWVEPLKTVNVNNERAMSTLVISK